MVYRKGRQAAVSDAARKLAEILWNMLVKKQLYQPQSEYLFLDQKRKLGLVKRIRKQIAKFDITVDELDFINT